MFVTFITIFFFFFFSNGYSNLTPIEILVLLSWIPASKEFFLLQLIHEIHSFLWRFHQICPTYQLWFTILWFWCDLLGLTLFMWDWLFESHILYRGKSISSLFNFCTCVHIIEKHILWSVTIYLNEIFGQKGHLPNLEFLLAACMWWWWQHVQIGMPIATILLSYPKGNPNCQVWVMYR